MTECQPWKLGAHLCNLLINNVDCDLGQLAQWFDASVFFTVKVVSNNSHRLSVYTP